MTVPEKYLVVLLTNLVNYLANDNKANNWSPWRQDRLLHHTCSIHDPFISFPPTRML